MSSASRRIRRSPVPGRESSRPAPRTRAPARASAGRVVIDPVRHARDVAAPGRRRMRLEDRVRHGDLLMRDGPCATGRSATDRPTGATTLAPVGRRLHRRPGWNPRRGCRMIGPVPDRRHLRITMAERSFAREVQKLRLGAGAGVSRRGHPRRHQGAARIRRRLRRRLPGRADLAPDGRAGRRAGYPRRTRRPLRELSASEAAAAATLAASVNYPLRGAVTFKSHGRRPTSPPTRSPTSPRAA